MMYMRLALVVVLAIIAGIPAYLHLTKSAAPCETIGFDTAPFRISICPTSNRH